MVILIQSTFAEQIHLAKGNLVARRLVQKRLDRPLEYGLDPERTVHRLNIAAIGWDCSNPERRASASADPHRSTQGLLRWLPRSEQVRSRSRRSPQSSFFPRRSQGCGLPMSYRRA